MKKSFAVFCAVVLMPGWNAQAWVGGPWSNNNSQPSGDDGVYEAVATMTNGTGMYRWAVRNNGTSEGDPSQTQQAGVTSSNVLFNGGLTGADSSNVWYYKGITYYGRTFGTVNSAMGVVSVVANATVISNSGILNGVPVDQVASASDTIDVQVNPATSSGGDNPIIIPGNALVQVRPQEFPGTANSSFTANINVRSGEVGKRFSGTGTIAFTREPNSVRIVGFSLDNVVVDRTIDGSTTSGEDQSDFSQQGHQRRFKVMGTQVSTQVLP